MEESLANIPVEKPGKVTMKPQKFITLSVIIPVFNEADVIAKTIRHLQQENTTSQIKEIIVVDGGSTDNTRSLAEKCGAVVIQSAKGRSVQMNAGAAIATGEVLYFLHADTLPPAGFLTCIINSIQSGFAMGCFRLQFDVEHWFLKSNAWFTRFNINAFRFGDQSLFVLKSIFEKSGGFNQNQIILEDQEIIKRLQRHGKFQVLKTAVITSTRKYVKNGIFKTQAVYFLIYFLYRFGADQQRLLTLYRSLIRQDKL